MATEGFWEFKAWVRVPGTPEGKDAALKAAEKFASEVSSEVTGNSLSIEDNEPTFEESD